MPHLRNHLEQRLGVNPAVEMLIREIQNEESDCRGQKNPHEGKSGADILSLS
jgi:hypothetical protein